MGKKLGVMLAMFILLFSAGPACALTSTKNEVSDPGRANKILSNFSNPIIEPGESGVLSLNLTNLYYGDFNNLTFTTEIYNYADLDKEKSISKANKPPKFENGETSYSITLEGGLPTNTSYPLEYDIDTGEETEEGVYMVRFMLEFDYSETGNHSVFKSKGYFSDERWDNATKRPGAGDEPYYSGKINITHLGVNGIIPDTTFSVKTPIPQWPRYVLLGLSGFFGIFAVMLYMQEEYNSFPWLEDILNQWSSKLKQFRRRLEYRFRDR